MSRLTQYGEYSHGHTLLGDCIEVVGGQKYLATTGTVLPSTVTIYNTAVSTDNWTAVATGLTGILAWKLKERSGEEFDYAFEAAPTPYMTSLGESLQRESEITAVYVKRRSAVTLNMQLECWSA